MNLTTPIITLACLLLALTGQAQQVNQLPSGRYATSLGTGGSKWHRGDIILIDDNRYRVSGQPDEGEYRTSITAQRIFFTSGPLRGAFARLSQVNSKPAITFPFSENSQQQLAATDVVAVLKH